MLVYEVGLWNELVLPHLSEEHFAAKYQPLRRIICSSRRNSRGSRSIERSPRLAVASLLASSVTSHVRSSRTNRASRATSLSLARTAPRSTVALPQRERGWAALAQAKNSRGCFVRPAVGVKFSIFFLHSPKGEATTVRGREGTQPDRASPRRSISCRAPN
jgi:hypothetical protein